MLKIEKYSFIFIFISFVLVIAIFLLAKEENPTKERIIANENDIDNILKRTNEELEIKYSEEFLRISDEYQDVLTSISAKMDDEVLDISEESYRKIDSLKLKMSSTRVPKKYKDVHLLFSRSLIKLSTYLNTTNPEDAISGIKLFEEAMEGYDKLSLS